MDISLSSRFSSTHSFGQHRSVHVLVTGSLLSLGRRVVMDVVGNEQTVLATALNPLYACSAEWGCALPGVVRLVSGVTLAHSNGGEPTIPQSSSGSGKCKQTQYTVTVLHKYALLLLSPPSRSTGHCLALGWCTGH